MDFDSTRLTKEFPSATAHFLLIIVKQEVVPLHEVF